MRPQCVHSRRQGPNAQLARGLASLGLPLRVLPPDVQLLGSCQRIRYFRILLLDGTPQRSKHNLAEPHRIDAVVYRSDIFVCGWKIARCWPFEEAHLCWGGAGHRRHVCPECSSGRQLRSDLGYTRVDCWVGHGLLLCYKLSRLVCSTTPPLEYADDHIIVAATWFIKRKTIAIGIVACGASIGT